MKLQLSNIYQLKEILDLVNIAYRGEKGWTRETDIVDGNRVSENEIKQAIEDRLSHLLVHIVDGQLLSCICITQENDQAYISLFSVHPEWQGRGIGSQVLSAAEEYAYSLGVTKYVMVVVSQRTELISYYERRGYIRTGRIEKYPAQLEVGTPKLKGLTIEYLEKNASPCYTR